MEIRSTGLNDIEKVYHLLCELEDKQLPFEQYREAYLINMNNPSVYYWICEDGGMAVAFASLHIQTLLHHCSPVAEIQELVVKAGYKGQGIGKKMVLLIKKTAIEKGCSLLEVCCNRKRTSSHIFYEHCEMENTHYKFTCELD